MNSGIYTITNLVDNKVYIGYALMFNTRKSDHWDKLKRNKHKNIYLQRAWNKYGEDNFSFEILEECEKQFLASLEHYWCTILDTHNPERGYNIRKTHPYSRVIVSEETKLKMSLLYKGKKLPKLTHEKIWKTRNENGWVMSQEHKEKIGKANKGRKYKSKKAKKVLQLDLDDNVIKEWESLTEAIRNNKGDIWACIKGIQKTTIKKFKWKYK